MTSRSFPCLLIASVFVSFSFPHAQKPTHGDVSDPDFATGLRALPGRTLVMNLETGGSLVVHGWNRDSVHVRGHLAGRDWPDTKVHLDRVPDGIRFRTSLGGSPLEKSTSHSFEIWVPRRFSIELQSQGGGIDIENVDGNFRGGTRGGSIELSRVRGRADLSTRGGNVVIRDSHLEGRVTTRGGAVRLTRVSGGVRAFVSAD